MSEIRRTAMRHLLVVGLGSIGQRHTRHFRRLGVERVDAYRTGKGALDVEGAAIPDRVFDDLDTALRAEPDGVVVANPTALHLDVARRALARGLHVLVEKPISHTLDGCSALLDEARANESVLVVGYNMRFHPFLQTLNTITRLGQLGRPLLARAHFGAWLPGWHPWEEYRRSYAGRADLGGGAALTSSHEIDYLFWLFGAPTFCAGAASPLQPLGTEVDETVVGVFRHPGGVVSTCSLTFAERPPRREATVTFEDGKVHLDFTAQSLQVFDAAGTMVHRQQAGAAVTDWTYGRQAEAFIHAADTGQMGDLCTGDEAVAVLEAALSLKEENE